jgi:uncharacterized OB-fold protein
MNETTMLPFTHASFQQHLSAHRLMGSRCAACGAMHLPPRAICPACRSAQMTWVEFSGRGRLAGFTSVFIPPTAMAQAGYGRENPYLSGVVELEEGPKISARLLGLDAAHPEGISIGQPLVVDFIDQGDGEKRSTVLAFRPLS